MQTSGRYFLKFTYNSANFRTLILFNYNSVLSKRLSCHEYNHVRVSLVLFLFTDNIIRLYESRVKEGACMYKMIWAKEKKMFLLDSKEEKYRVVFSFVNLNQFIGNKAFVLVFDIIRKHVAEEEMTKEKQQYYCLEG